ncbi:amidohydrolase/deacetylase family metallohydrolase [Enterococcus sp. AZ109]|uniref:amidohydrolase/deacetylase family metallohydrolase n=1 Tax=Enterococcus sp. AZ109 TaxID=2774634 RepID=UPI003F1E9E5C
MSEVVLKNGRLITGVACEVAFAEGKITEVAEVIEAGDREVIDLQGNHFSAGWIDSHVHCYQEMNLYYDFPDQIGVEKGVTTVIDAGTTGAENIGRFYKLAKEAKTNVYALLNISKFGIVEQDELADLTKVQAELVKQALTELPEFIIGIKARMSKTVIGNNGITPLNLAKEIQAENQELPLMVHIGSAPPELQEILTVMGPGDILTHCFNGKPNGIIDQTTGKIKEFVWQAYRDGILFDIGHGTDSFNFDVAETAFKANMFANTISTDIYIRNRTNGPVYDLATTLEKLHTVGYEWPAIIEKITTAAADQYHLSQKGRIEVGKDADFTIFKIIDEEKELVDSNGNTRQAKQQIIPVKTIIGGAVYDNQL